MTEYGDIYLMRSKGDNIPYVGVSVDVDRRLKEHKRNIDINKHHSYKINKYCINKNKCSNDFFFSIIEKSISKNELSNKEKYWINYYDSYNNGFNCTLGGEFLIGENHPRAKITNKTAICIMNDFLSGNFSIDKLNEKYNTNVSSEIINGVSWSFLFSKNTLKKSKEISKQRNIEHNKRIANKRKSNLYLWDNNLRTIKEISQTYNISISFATACIKEHCITKPIDINNINGSIYCFWDNTIQKRKDVTSKLKISNATLTKYLNIGIQNTNEYFFYTKNHFQKIKILYNGICFYSIGDATNFLKKDRTTIKKWLKTGKAQYID